MIFPCWACETLGLERCSRHHPVVCVCEAPQPDSIGECQRCYRPFGARFTSDRARWRSLVLADRQRLAHLAPVRDLRLLS